MDYHQLFCDREFIEYVWPFSIVQGLYDISSQPDVGLILIDVPQIQLGKFAQKIKPSVPFPIAIYSPGYMAPKVPPNIIYSGETSARFSDVVESKNTLIYLLESGFRICVAHHLRSVDSEKSNDDRSFMELLRERIDEEDELEYLEFMIDDFNKILIGITSCDCMEI